MSDTPYRQLHDRLSRGELLTETELYMLQTWYDQQDTEEDKQINQSTPLTDTNRQVQQHISQVALQLQPVTQEIAATISANDALRADIVALQARLVQEAPE